MSAWNFIGECCVLWIFGFELPFSPQWQILKQFKHPILLKRLTIALAFLIGAPWLIQWWGIRKYFQSIIYFLLLGRTFEIDYEEVLKRHRHRIKGVLHIGAHTAKEASIYHKLHLHKVIWVEMQPQLRPSIIDELKRFDLLHMGHRVSWYIYCPSITTFLFFFFSFLSPFFPFACFGSFYPLCNNQR